MTAIPFNYSLSQDSLKDLDYIVAKAGGSIPQLNLFKYLLSPSISYINKDNPLDKGILFDYRAGCSLLFLFPPQIQAILAIFFYLRELDIETQFSIKFDLTSKIQSPSSILQIHEQLTSIPLSFSLRSFLSLQNFKDSKSLKFLLGVEDTDSLINLFFSNSALNKDLEILFNLIPYSNQSSSFLEKFKEISLKNNRLESAVLLSESFNYSFTYIQSIVNLSELWLLQNSST